MANGHLGFETFFWDEAIQPYLDYVEHKQKKELGLGKDLTLSMNAAYNLYHVREKLPKEYQKDYVKDYPEYDLLGDIVNAYKHGKPDRAKAKGRTRWVEGRDSIFENTAVITYRDEQGDYRSSEKQVIVHLTNNVVRDVYEVLTNVANMWFTELFTQGLLSKLYHFDIVKLGNPVPTRINSNGEFIRHIQARPTDDYLTFTFSFYHYNYRLAKALPDTEETGVRTRIENGQVAQMRPIPVDDASQKEETTVKVVLSPDQRDELESLQTEDERREFIQRIMPEILDRLNKAQNNT